MSRTISPSKTPRTFAEFEKYRQELFSTDFQGRNLHPIAFGMERTKFEIERLRQLIQVAEQIEGVTIKGRLEGWKRQMQRLESAHQRFQNLASGTELERNAQRQAASKN